MRMQLRRFTRLTNAFSKSLSHLKAAVSLQFAFYNFLPSSFQHSVHSRNGSRNLGSHLEHQ
jgi:hypothetical protein